MKKALKIVSHYLILALTVSVCQAQTPSNTPFITPHNDNFRQIFTEVNMSSGLEFLAEGDYLEAERKFLDALHGVKINHGMHSPLQIPVIEQLIDSQIPQGDWATVQQYISYFDWLNGELYQTGFEDYLYGTTVLSRLYLKAAADMSNPRSAHYLVGAKNLNWNVISVLEAIYGRESEVLKPWLYQVVSIHVYQSNLVRRRGLTSYNYKTDEPAIVNGWSLSKNESLQKSYNIGSELLERLRDIEIANNNVQGVALVNLYQGDWETMFENGAKAVEFYLAAYAGLLESGVEISRIDKLFAQTSILPEKKYFSTFSDLEASRSTQPNDSLYAWSPNFPSVPVPDPSLSIESSFTDDVEARVKFDLNMDMVTELMGYKEIHRSVFRKTNLSLVSISVDNSVVAERALRDVSLLKVRPRFAAGKLVPSHGITVNYHFSEQAIPALLSEN